MKAQRLLVLDGHPAPQSLCKSLADAYADGAKAANHEVRLVHLNGMQFDMDHGVGGYRGSKPLEAPLEHFLGDLAWADHLVLTTPIWWGGLPAKLKGLFDRALLPGRAFDPREPVCGAPKPLLINKSARVIVTSDTPGWFLRVAYRNALFHQVRKQIFRFVGIRPTRFTHFSLASHATPETVDVWMNRVRDLGAAAA